MIEFMRPELEILKPQPMEKKQDYIPLHLNESYLPLSSQVKNNLKEFIEHYHFNYYPDDNCQLLKTKLASVYGLAEENFLIGNGSDELIDFILRSFLNPGEKILSLSPSFDMYGVFACINHGKERLIPFDKNFAYPVNEMIRQLQADDVKLLIICSPNNPTGNCISDEDLKKILESTKKPVVLDEAYADFYQTGHANWIKQYPHLICLRTFSKAYGAAGARIGYMISQKMGIQIVNKVRGPFNVSGFSQQIALEILKDTKDHEEKIAAIRKEKENLEHRLSQFKELQCYPSYANFVYVYTKIPLFDLCFQHKILIKNCHNNYYRITVGNRHASDCLLLAISAYVKKTLA